MLVAACASLVMTSTARATDVRVYGTSDTTDSLLVSSVIEPDFEAANPGYDLKYTAVGTGAALKAGKDGLADAVLTHAPTSEAQFVKDGFTQGLGQQIFYSDYVIIGPASDPAGVKANHPHDAVGAFEAIAAAGATAGSKVFFRSRNNSSGTNVQEEIIWGLSNVSPKAVSENAAGDTTRYEPCSAPAPGTGCPDWYQRLTGNPNQATTVTGTETCITNGNFCYTMVDRGTFNRFKNQADNPIPDLEILSDLNNGPGAKGGNTLQINPFNVYVMSTTPPTAYPSGITPDTAAAQRFVDFLKSPALQARLASFPNTVQPAFFADAAPAVDVASPPAAVTKGSPVTITGTVRNQLPGAGTISGVPVKLVTGDAAPFTGTGASTTSGADGSFSLTTTVTARTHYQLVTGDAPVANKTPVSIASYTGVAGTTKDVGVIDATAAAGASPTPSPSPSPSPTPDTKKPKASKLKLSKKKLTLRVSERSTVVVRVYRKGKRILKVTRKPKKAGTVVIRKGVLRKKGRYRIKLTITDAAGNRSTLSKVVTLK